MKDSIEHFNELVRPYILSSMEYKLLGHSSLKTPLNGEKLSGENLVGNPVLNP